MIREVKLGCGKSRSRPVSPSRDSKTFLQMEKMDENPSFVMPQFPAANSPQRSSVTLPSSVSRKKVGLKKGHSLMDWIRLGRSGKDLTGVGNRILEVTEEELARHKVEDDAWMAIRGKVYNITPYLDFHPGGIDELMRGAGKDGTELFDEVHRWVNVESMLEKCYIGRLKTDQKLSRKGSNSSVKSNISSRLLVAPSINVSAKEELNKKPPSYEWTQTESSIIVTIYTRWNEMRTEYIVIDRNEKDLKIMAFIKRNNKYQIHIVLEEYVTSDYKVKLKDSSTAEIQFKKQEPAVSWTSFGEPNEQHDIYLQKINLERIQRDCHVDSIVQLTHNTKLLRILLPDGFLMNAPMGYHVRLYHTIEDVEVFRQYTLVLPSLLPSRMDSSVDNGRVIYLMIKIYEDGTLTEWIDKLTTGNPVKLSMYEGDFKLDKLINCTHLIMFAAGTGFTPMIQLIHYALTSEDCSIRLVNLLCFYRTEEDIIWREDLDKLSAQFERFCVKYVLSEPSSNWAGTSGHINEELVRQYLPPASSLVDEKMLICACGPTPFTANAMRLARHQGYKDNCLHPFLS